MNRMPITTTSTIEQVNNESAVSHLVEYIIITAVVLIFLVITIPMVNVAFVEGPTNILTYHAYTDIGNGVSTRIIDLYAIIPYGNNATITTKFDIPDEVAGRDYWVVIVPGPADRPYDNSIVIDGGYLVKSTVSLAGIGETVFGRTGGRTTASGLNYIEFEYP